MIGNKRIRAEIDLDALRYNIIELKKCVREEVKTLAVIKADGYGHGSCVIAKHINDLVQYYGVATIDEAVELRNYGIDKNILILGYVPSVDFKTIIDYNITQTVYDLAEAQRLSQVALEKGKKALVHIKVDTGMSRIGVQANEEGLKVALDIASLEGLSVEGIFTHYAKADEEDKTSAIGQYNKFKEFVNCLESNGLNFAIKHIDNSAGVMEMDDDEFNMIRIGIAMYGLYPSEEVKREIVLKPVMTFKAHIAHIKKIQPGAGVSYGWDYFAPEERVIATITAGYADGYPRAQTNIGKVIINGEFAPILGRVCMDQFMVDVTDISNINIGSEVVLFGSDNGKTISVEEVAKPANSFNYELVCNVARRVPRVYYQGGIEVDSMNYLI